MKQYHRKDYKQKLEIVIRELEGKLIEREEIIRLIILVIFAKHHIFLIGVPGVAKTYLLTIVSSIIKDTSLWQILMTKDTREHHLVGVEHSNDPLSRFLSLLQPDNMQNYLDNGLNKNLKSILSFFNIKSLLVKKDEDKEALKKQSMMFHEFLLFDEMFKAPDDLLVSTLSVLNERYFTSKGKAIPVPVNSVFSASNEIPFGVKIEPFIDRILVWYEVKSIQNKENYKRYINGQFDKTKTISASFTKEELEYCQVSSNDIIVPDHIQEKYVELERAISKDGIKASNRKFGPDYIIKALKTSAWLNGRDEVDYSDLFLIRHFAWHSFLERDKLWRVVHDTLYANKDIIETQIDELYREYENIHSYYNRVLLDFTMYSEDLYGASGQEIFSSKKSDLIQYISILKTYHENMKNIHDQYIFFSEVDKLNRENIFLHNIKCQTFKNKETRKKVESFLIEKEGEIQELESWIKNNAGMDSYQINQHNLRTGKI